VGWWKFDESSATVAIDWSGHDNDGTLIGSPERVPGYSEGALELGGSPDYVELPNSLVGSTLGSVAFWIKTTQTGYGHVFYGSAESDENG